MVKPLKVLDMEYGDEVWDYNGRLMRSVKITFDRESTQRIRHGYACAKCLGVFDRAWPEKCPQCGAPIRARQAEFFAREYLDGEVKLGPSVSLSDELASLHERVAKGEDT